MGHVRFGSLADMCNANSHVRYRPEADMCSALGLLVRQPDSSVPCHGAEGSPPRNCDQPYADPIESDPAVSLDLQAFGWSVPASRFKKPFDGGAKV
jgi:hypothetical protein